MEPTTPVTDGSNADRPLAGCCVCITRPAPGAAELIEPLRAAGADPLHTPVIEFASEGAASDDELCAAVDSVHAAGGWLILPSATAVRAFASRYLQRPGESGRVRNLPLVAVPGEGSAQTLMGAGIEPAFISPEPSGAALGEALPLQPATPVLIAGARATRPELPEALKRRGACVRHVALYSTRPCGDGLERLRERILAARAVRPPEHALALVASPSAVDAVLDTTGHDEPCGWVAIGATTAGRLIERGIAAERIETAEQPTTEALVRATIALAKRIRR